MENHVVDKSSVHSGSNRDCNSVAPLVRWAGSKTWLAPKLVPIIREHLSRTGGRYIEPFLGGGAVAFALGAEGMLLGDASKPLISMYQAVRYSPAGVNDMLQTLVECGTDRETYLAVRASTSDDLVIQAAQFIYLNALSFNGLYRVNRRGIFNVPYGGPKWGREVIDIPSVQDIGAVSFVLSMGTLFAADFGEVFDLVNPGDVVFCDPPYWNVYASYTPEGFVERDQRDLAERLHELAKSGIRVFATNADAPEIREMYSWATIESTAENHKIAARAGSRGAKPGVLILSKHVSHGKKFW